MTSYADPFTYLILAAGLICLYDIYLHSKGEPLMSIGDFFKHVGQIAPIVLSVIPGVPPILVPIVTQAIQDAEKLVDAPGPIKLQAVKDEVHDAINLVNSAKPGTIDPAIVETTIVPAVNATIATVKAVEALKG